MNVKRKYGVGVQSTKEIADISTHEVYIYIYISVRSYILFFPGNKVNFLFTFQYRRITDNRALISREFCVAQRI